MLSDFPQFRDSVAEFNGVGVLVAEAKRRRGRSYNAPSGSEKVVDNFIVIFKQDIAAMKIQKGFLRRWRKRLMKSKK